MRDQPIADVRRVFVIALEPGAQRLLLDRNADADEADHRESRYCAPSAEPVARIHLPARIPLAVALELGLTGEYIDAERALALGLVNRVVAPEAVVPTAMELAGQIVANGPLAVTAILRTLRETESLSETDAFAIEGRLGMEVMGSNDAAEGPRAFLEKRPPQFTGT